jgi:hypothetical protein
MGDAVALTALLLWAALSFAASAPHTLASISSHHSAEVVALADSSCPGGLANDAGVGLRVDGALLVLRFSDIRIGSGTCAIIPECLFSTRAA